MAAPPSRDALAGASDDSGYALNLLGVYQDNVTRDWALTTWRFTTQLLGEEHVQNTWYNVDSLKDSAILSDAIHDALMADVIVVSVYAADELPLELYAWIDIWLPRRRLRSGALAALVGVTDPLDDQSIRTHEYLQAVARRGLMDYIPQARKWPLAPSVASINPIMEGASTIGQVPKDPRGQRYGVQWHWGLND